MIDAPWSQTVRLPDAGAPEHTTVLIADEATRVAIARELAVSALHRLEAKVSLRPWLDGAEVRGVWTAVVNYECGVTLQLYDQPLEGAFCVRVVPQGSPNAPTPDAEINLDPEAPEPPDVVEGGAVDLAAYVVEHLALEIDPFPRKPGAQFVQPPEPPEASPFGKLLQLRPGGSNDA